MSCKGRGKEATPFDYHPTPEWPVHRLLDYLSYQMHPVYAGETYTSMGQTVFEPCAGDGAIIRSCLTWKEGRLKGSWRFVAVEIQDRFAPALGGLVGACNYWIGDTRKYLYSGEYDLIITNPPFSLAQEIIEHHLRHATSAFYLLRVGFNGTPDRTPWLKKLRPNLYQLSDRPAFTLNKEGKLGTDGSEYAWFEFGVHTTGQVHYLDPTPKAELKKARSDQIELLKRWP